MASKKGKRGISFASFSHLPFTFVSIFFSFYIFLCIPKLDTIEKPKDLQSVDAAQNKLEKIKKATDAFDPVTFPFFSCLVSPGF